MRALIIVTTDFSAHRGVLWDQFLQQANKVLLQVNPFRRVVRKADLGEGNERSVVKFEFPDRCILVFCHDSDINVTTNAILSLLLWLRETESVEICVAGRKGFVDWNRLKEDRVMSGEFFHDRMFKYNTRLRDALEQLAETPDENSFDLVWEAIDN